MNAIEYLGEDGTGRFGRWHVPDLTPAGSAVELIFVFESPHVDELKARVPVFGAAGKSAIRFLLSDPTLDTSLGRFVQQRHSEGDGRIAVMNVSNVPMQAAAFVNSEAPEVVEEDWARIERVRTSRARTVASMRGDGAREISEVLVRGLRDRLDALTRNSECRLVAAGVFARRMVDAVPDDLIGARLHVPHPSFNQWGRVVNHEQTDLVELRRHYGRAVRSASSR